MRHDPKKLADATQAWNDGMSWPEIAERFQFVTVEAGMMAVRNNAKRHGLKLRFANGNNDAKRRAKSAELRDKGVSLTEIAVQLGWSDGGAAFRGIERHERTLAMAAFAKERKEKERKEKEKAKEREKGSKNGAGG